MPPELIRPIESPKQVAEYYKIIHNAIGGNVGDGDGGNADGGDLWLVKQEGWIVAVAYDGSFYTTENKVRLMKLMLANGYQEFIAMRWSDIELSTPGYVIPATVDGINEFWYHSYHWYVFFAGEPNWFILVAHTLDFILVGGLPAFVRQVLGCEPEEASITIRGMSESKNINPRVRKYYIHLLEEIEVTYPKAEPGTVINLGLLNWDETPQAL